MAVFQQGVDAVCAVGEFVHVFVDRATGRPALEGMGDVLRRGLEKLRADVDVDADAKVAAIEEGKKGAAAVEQGKAKL